MKEILALPFSKMKVHIRELADKYYELAGKRVCTSCPGDVQNMINYLKKYYMETNFQLKGERVIYRLSRETSMTISNNKMSDELALEFLRIDPTRIRLFSKYPENWEEMLEGEEAVVKPIETQPEDEDILEARELEEEKRAELEQFKLSELREMYPDIKDTSKAGFIDQIFKA